jgi:hypothetical protein
MRFAGFHQIHPQNQETASATEETFIARLTALDNPMEHAWIKRRAVRYGGLNSISQDGRLLTVADTALKLRPAAQRAGRMPS